MTAQVCLHFQDDDLLNKTVILKPIWGTDAVYKVLRNPQDCDHGLSKRLARSVQSGATLVFEDPTNIRSRAKRRKAQRRRLHGWSFAQLQAFVTDKAEARGVNVGLVDPRYTSQKCSQCGHIERGNRPSQAELRCKKCGYECHVDYNAAINIREDFLKLRASVNVPIVVCPEMGT